MLRKANNRAGLRICVTAAVLLVLAALSPAPVYQQQNRFLPEASQDDLAAQQDMQGVQPNVGEVPLNLKPEGTNPGAELAHKTRALLNSGNADVTISALHVAQERVEASKPAPGKAVLWVVFGSLAGFGVFFWFRRWADKNVPTHGGF